MILLMICATLAQCQMACMRRNHPVCGRNGKTYSNDCFARLDNVDIECQGKCPCTEKIVVSSDGAAAVFQGGVLGQYQYDSEKDHYVQSNSETHHEDYEPKYIFRNA